MDEDEEEGEIEYPNEYNTVNLQNLKMNLNLWFIPEIEISTVNRFKRPCLFLWGHLPQECSFRQLSDVLFHYNKFKTKKLLSRRIDGFKKIGGIMYFIGLCKNEKHEYSDANIKILVFKTYENEPQFNMKTVKSPENIVDYHYYDFFLLNFLLIRGKFPKKDSGFSKDIGYPIFVLPLNILTYKNLISHSLFSMHLNQTFFLNYIGCDHQTSRFIVSPFPYE